MSEAARTAEEYRSFMTDLGYEGEDLENQVDDWIKFRRSRDAHQ